MKTPGTGRGNTGRLRSISGLLRIRLYSLLLFWAAVGWDVRRAAVVAAVPIFRDWAKRRAVFSVRGFSRR
jgi:hypothetical protein